MHRIIRPQRHHSKIINQTTHRKPRNQRHYITLQHPTPTSNQPQPTHPLKKHNQHQSEPNTQQYRTAKTNSSVLLCAGQPTAVQNRHTTTNNQNQTNTGEQQTFLQNHRHNFQMTKNHQYHNSHQPNQATSCHNNYHTYPTINQHSTNEHHEQHHDQPHTNEPHQQPHRPPINQVTDKIQQTTNNEHHDQLIDIS